MTQAPAAAQPNADGGRREGSETVVRAWQRGGGRLDRRGVTKINRMVRLRRGLAMASPGLGRLGRWGANGATGAWMMGAGAKGVAVGFKWEAGGMA
ncbi:MAG: hypothetical protein RMJ48_06865 [Roseiflexaceae bacterium]|nr:hypothetical protein [Roseiflexaceae bacterium]